MTQTKQPGAPSDAELVAYLDGELSPADSVLIGQRIASDAELGRRVAFLMKGGRPFRTVMEPLLSEAPAARLEAMLSDLLAREGQGRKVPGPRWPSRWPMGLAAGFVLVLAGAGLDRLAVRLAAAPPQSVAASSDGSDDWRRVVAQYLSLTTRDTLSVIRDSDAARQQELADVGSRVGLDLRPERVNLPDLALKRAEAFDYDGKALAHVAYLDPASGPLSLCIFARPQADAPPRTERRRGMNVVYWSRNNRGFMLIGHASVERLQSLAETVADRFDPDGSEPTTQDHG